MNISYETHTDARAWFTAHPLGVTDLTYLARLIKEDTEAVIEPHLVRFFEHQGTLMVACDGKKIVGAACLVKVFKYNGFTYRLEHVSVHPEYRGHGIARHLVTELMKLGEREGRYIDLTCEPCRVNANWLYGELGFKERDTNPRRFVISEAVTL